MYIAFWLNDLDFLKYNLMIRKNWGIISFFNWIWFRIYICKIWILLTFINLTQGRVLISIILITIPETCVKINSTGIYQWKIDWFLLLNLIPIGKVNNPATATFVTLKKIFWVRFCLSAIKNSCRVRLSI